MKTILPIVVIGTLAAVFGENAEAKKYVADPAATAGPSYYQNLVKKLRPGDTLFLPAGTYNKRLNLNGLQGTAEAWITITGPDTGMAAVITTNSKCCNNVQLGNTAYVALKNLTVDANSEGVNASIDGINAKGGVTHDILIENCVIKGVSRRQSTIGISTKSMARNWIIRGNTIIEAGTGIYLGNSTGAAPFIRGIIEGNLIVDSIGYNLQIKHQNPYSPPREPGAESLRTIIRDNVFLKRIPQSSVPEKKRSGARPNVLVGGFPDTGPGSSDLYEIYGNFFFENKDGESLLQATGRVSIHDNVFVGGSRSAVALRDHNGRLKLAHVYNNTIFGAPAGIRVHNAAQTESIVTGNLIFAETPIAGVIGQVTDNLTDSGEKASKYVKHPSKILGSMDFYPLPGQCTGSAIDSTRFVGQTDYSIDFNGKPKDNFTFRGAYSGDGTNPGWNLDAKRMLSRTLQ